MDELLFIRGDLGFQLRHELSRVIEIVAAMAPDDLLDRSDEEVVAVFMQARAVPSLELLWDQAWSPGPQETRLDVQRNLMYGGAGEGRPIFIAADEIRIHVPYTGDRELLQLRPSTYTLNPPLASVGVDEIVHTVTAPGLTSEQVTGSFEQFRKSVTQHVEATNRDVQQHNRQVEQALTDAVAQRRQRLLSQRNLAASLPFQVRPPASGATYPLPIRPTKVHLTQPRAARPFQPEPTLEDAIYEDILRRLTAFGRAVERTPVSVGALDEEGLRDHLLLLLNGSYEGQATGEVFNRRGKTDILVRSGDRNVFIAECKVWNGKTKFVSAVDQLLSYLVWRDGKAALILFIKTGDPTAVVAKADAAIAGHPSCLRRFEPADPTTRIDYLLQYSADPDRSVHTALLPIAIAA